MKSQLGLRVLSIFVLPGVLVSLFAPSGHGVTNGVHERLLAQSRELDCGNTYIFKGQNITCVGTYKFPKAVCKEIRKYRLAWVGFRQSGRQDRERAFIASVNKVVALTNKATATTKDKNALFAVLAAGEFNDEVVQAYKDGLYDLVDTYTEDFSFSYCP